MDAFMLDIILLPFDFHNIRLVSFNFLISTVYRRYQFLLVFDKNLLRVNPIHFNNININVHNIVGRLSKGIDKKGINFSVLHN